MNTFRVAFVLAIAIIATSSANYADNNGNNAYDDSASGYGKQENDKSYGPSDNSYDSPASYDKEVVPHSEIDKVDTVSTSIGYPENKGEMYIHRPAAIVFRRPETKIVLKHPAFIYNPRPVIFHKPPSVVVRKVFVKQHPQSVKVHPVTVNVEKSPSASYYLSEKQQKQVLPAILKSAYTAPEGYAPASYDSSSGPAESSAPNTDQSYNSDKDGADYSAYANIARTAAANY